MATNDEKQPRRRRSGEKSAFRSHEPDDTTEAADSTDVPADAGAPADAEDLTETDSLAEADNKAEKRRSSKRRRDSGNLAIRCEELSKSYGDLAALSSIELDVPKGQAVVLVGHNGSGKSTLLSLIAGTLEPSSGDIQIHGHGPETIEARSQRSWLPDNPVLYDDLTVDEHLEYVSRLHGQTDSAERIDELVERLGLSERRDQLPSQFSRGLRQKTAIAVALCRPFSVLLVDEPFVGLDASGRATMLELLKESAQAGSTLMVATHDPAVIEEFERGLLLSNGELVHDGAADEMPSLISPS